MAYGQTNGQPKKDRGRLYKSDPETMRGPKSPHYWGYITWRGEDIKISGWREPDSKGKDSISLSLKPKLEERRQSYDRAQAPQERYPDQDEF